MIVVFLPSLFIIRGLYDVVPFFLALAMSVLVAYFLVVTERLVWRADLSFLRQRLKQGGRITRKGWIFLGSIVIGLALMGHSAAVHYHSAAGLAKLGVLREQGITNSRRARKALDHLEKADRWGFLATARVQRGIVELMAATGRHAQAEPRIRALMEQHPEETSLRVSLAECLFGQGRIDEALSAYDTLIEGMPEEHSLLFARARVLFAKGRFVEAREQLEEYVLAVPGDMRARSQLGALHVQLGHPAEAFPHLRLACEQGPVRAEAYHNLAVAYHAQGRIRPALAAVEEAIRIAPHDPTSHRFREHLVSLLSRNGSR